MVVVVVVAVVVVVTDVVVIFAGAVAVFVECYCFLKIIICDHLISTNSFLSSPPRE